MSTSMIVAVAIACFGLVANMAWCIIGARRDRQQGRRELQFNSNAIIEANLRTATRNIIGCCINVGITVGLMILMICRMLQ